MKKGLFIMVVGIIALGFICSCTTLKGVKSPSAPVTVCDSFPGDSLIEKYIPDLRTANTIIKLSIYEISKLDQVKKKDIVKILDEVENLANSSTTYNQMFVYLMSKIKYIRENMGAEIVIAGDDLIAFQDVATPISQKDICYIKYQVKEDRDKVLPWIK